MLWMADTAVVPDAPSSGSKAEAGPTGETSIADELARRAASGDRAAAAEFFRQNQRMLRSMARRMASDVLDPEDLLSEAVTTLLERWARGAGPDRSIVAYLISTMRNRVIDELR